jgi:hypothetical protein
MILYMFYILEGGWTFFSAYSIYYDLFITKVEIKA